MGDTGSLALGAVLGVMAVILKHEIILAIAGIVFVAETISVIIQVAYFKKTGKRFFKMAPIHHHFKLTHGKRVFKMTPIHHHFEQLGWSETKVVYTFWVITLGASLLALLNIL